MSKLHWNYLRFELGFHSSSPSSSSPPPHPPSPPPSSSVSFTTCYWFLLSQPAHSKPSYSVPVRVLLYIWLHWSQTGGNDGVVLFQVMFYTQNGCMSTYKYPWNFRITFWRSSEVATFLYMFAAAQCFGNTLILSCLNSCHLLAAVFWCWTVMSSHLVCCFWVVCMGIVYKHSIGHVK